MDGSNYHVIFLKRPGVNGTPSEDCFRHEKCAQAHMEGSDDVIVRTLYLSVDPALRCRMNESTGVAYMAPWDLGATVVGLGGVGVVTQSAIPAYSVGDIVAGSMEWPWKLQFATDHKKLMKIDVIPPGYTPSVVLSCLGLIGLTVLIGIQQKGNIDPNKNQTFVVSGAAGACGTLAGQIAKILGCKTIVGICGSAEKCIFLQDELQFDRTINYKEDDVEGKLRDICTHGIDIYFDNVGGEISDQVVRKMNNDAHVILCGQISQYNKDVPYPPPLNDETAEIVKEKNITRDRYLVLNYQDKFPSATKQLLTWLTEGKLKVKESVVEGLENAGKAFVGMMKGENTGKQLVRVSPL